MSDHDRIMTVKIVKALKAKIIQYTILPGLLSLFLVIVFLRGSDFSAWAEAGAETGTGTELSSLVETYLRENGLDASLVGVSFYCPDTGESWDFNGDQSFYSASLYKVPLAMIYAEKISAGEMGSDTELFGLKVEDLEYEILVNSDNDLAYSMLCYLGEPSAVRALFCRYADLPEDYYDWSFYGMSDFTPRFMTEVLKTLYEEESRFPGVMSLMKQAQPGHYFRLDPAMDSLVIAQKYGYLLESDGSGWSHCAGIIEAETPFILTVMTRYPGMGETIAADLACLFHDYVSEGGRSFP